MALNCHPVLPDSAILEVKLATKILSNRQAIFTRNSAISEKSQKRRFFRDFYVKTGLPPRFFTLGKILGFGYKFYLKEKLAIFGQKIAKTPRFLEFFGKIAKFGFLRVSGRFLKNIFWQHCCHLGDPRSIPKRVTFAKKA